jgi:two-component system nitrogen regulation response regulator NtrX
LRAFRWPGNVRELRNVVERVLIMAPGDLITPAELGFLDVTLPPALRDATGATVVRPLHSARDAWERDYILAALAACDGNISRTADALDVERSNLYKKMRGLGIGPAREG